MRGERALVNRIRELTESSNPVPANVYQDEAPHQAEIAALLTELRLAPPEPPDQQFVDPIPADALRSPHSRKRRDTVWRVLAPVLSGFAVVAVVTALTVAAGRDRAGLRARRKHLRRQRCPLTSRRSAAG